MHINIKLTPILSGLALTIASFCTYSQESHMAEALKHAQAAAQTADAKAIVEHAEAATTHAKTADEHLDTGIKSLEAVLEHGRMGHADMAKKAAEEAATHRKAAQ